MRTGALTYIWYCADPLLIVIMGEALCPEMITRLGPYNRLVLINEQVNSGWKRVKSSVVWIILRVQCLRTQWFEIHVVSCVSYAFVPSDWFGSDKHEIKELRTAK